MLRFRSYMFGIAPPPNEVAIDERRPSVSVLLDAGRDSRAVGGGVDTEDRSPATPEGSEIVESTESRGWTACDVAGYMVGPSWVLCTPPERVGGTLLPMNAA